MVDFTLYLIELLAYTYEGIPRANAGSERRRKMSCNFADKYCRMSSDILGTHSGYIFGINIYTGSTAMCRVLQALERRY